MPTTRVSMPGEASLERHGRTLKLQLRQGRYQYIYIYYLILVYLLHPADAINDQVLKGISDRSRKGLQGIFLADQLVK